ncbi:MAG: YvcK family protein [Pseudomonadales bacterium]|jgi:uncharacterized cofD-like protein|nr:YvcK family protein [Pseudomonadales bacterium]
MADKKSVVVIGGGTGTSTVLSGLKQLPNIALTAIVAVSDNGGNSGQLRDEYGFVPVGDMRQCLAALADGKHSDKVRELLLYRFGGDNLQGYNLGNLILTALEDMYKSPGKAVEVAGDILRTTGHVYPISESATDLIIHYEDGTKIVGEDYLNYVENGGKKIKKIALTKKVNIYQKAARAIEKADLIIMGPGDLYASLLPNTLVDGFKESLQKNAGKFVYIVNLMNSFQQTHQMTTANYVEEITKYSGRNPDVVIINNEAFDQTMLKIYKKHGETPMIDDMVENKQTKILRLPLVAKVKVERNKNDLLSRGILRHDAAKVSKAISDLLNND